MKTTKASIKPLSKECLRALIFEYGLQASIFDKSIFILDWEGLEYQFYVREERLLLHAIIVRKDVVINVV
jgi:hypothetical protein